jgi:hypothetical protein
MKFSWKIAASILCLAVICGAAIAWKLYEKRKADEFKLVEAAKVCRVSAEQGDAKAQYRLGYMYSHGQGVPQDSVEAVRWYRKSADQGNAMGESALAFMYSKGRGIEQNYNEALNLYRKSADQGYAKAQFDLGEMYYYGEGVPQNNAEAVLWYRKAADHGYMQAQNDLGYMYFYGYGMPRDRAEAERWYHKAADQGDEYAQLALGLRVPALNKFSQFFLILSFLVGLFILSDHILPKKRIKKPLQVNTLLAGIICLSYAVWRLFGGIFINLFHSAFAVCLFYFIGSLMGGILVVFLFSIVIPKWIWIKSAKIALGVFTAMFMINNGLLIFLYHKYHAVPGNCLIYKANGLPIGASVLLAIYLLKPHTESGEQQGNSVDGLEEIPAENEDELNQENEECSHAG